MKRIPILFLALILILSTVMVASSFRLNFTDAYLVYVPSSKTLQITAHGRVLSYGSGWIVQQVQPYLYHMKLNTWQGFFWKINTSQKKVFKTTNGQFGTNIGYDTQLNVTLDVVGGSNNVPPTRFLIRFNDAYLIYVIETQAIQIIAQSMVLSYANDWNKAQIYPYLFHIRLATWQGFFWKVNTSRKQLYEVRNGTFGAIAPGTETTLPIPVTTQ
jgi:hypothetical protein